MSDNILTKANRTIIGANKVLSNPEPKLSIDWIRKAVEERATELNIDFDTEKTLKLGINYRNGISPKDEEEPVLTIVKSCYVGRLRLLNGKEEIVKVGDKVKEGDVVVKINALDIDNQVISPCYGIIAKISLPDNAIVDYGKELLVIRVIEEPKPELDMATSEEIEKGTLIYTFQPSKIKKSKEKKPKRSIREVLKDAKKDAKRVLRNLNKKNRKKSKTRSRKENK